MEPTNPTLCQDCDLVALDSREYHPRYWLCLGHRRLPGYGFVTLAAHPKQAPFLFCRDVNGGCCPLWMPRRVEENAP